MSEGRKMHSRIITKEVTVVKQTLEELIDDNKEHIEWLRKTYGQKSVDKFIKHLEDELSYVPPTGTKIKMQLVEVNFANSEDDSPKS